MQQLGRRFLLTDGLRQVSPYVGDELRAEANAGVVILDGFLQAADVDVRQLAGVAVASSAEEVGVDIAVAVLGVREDHAALGAAEVLATPAEQRTLEVVVVHPAPFVGHAARLKDALHPLEQLVVDEVLVPPLVLLAFEPYEPDVVPIPQQVRELADRDLRLRVPAVGPHPEPAVVQLVGEIGQGVVTGGVQLEGQLDERAALRVNDHCPDLAAVAPLDDVEVADWRPPQRAAVLGLLLHLVGDVRAALAGGVLVDDRQHAVEHAPCWGVVNVLLDG
ncbi:hypothetical protein QCN29_09760 [Streptomyces sp. HNM0663]|uniref:Uncharacterized protein n=1 Tax=Streptomyces chengmaiensis TaxID=3040919 RepID=A0ABT6HL54_9ACTN|nr:hypothetical protein [Streptomyces chengmaiensis]MDH2389071.1 hypothetical protein [Streptomyces chengmaiensis]